MSNREYEIRIYDIDENKIKRKIKQLGGKMVQKKMVMPIIVYYHPLNKKDFYIRIRNEGAEITMTLKTDISKKYPIEREIVINSVEEGDAILQLLGCKLKYKIEKIREIWKIKGCKEIVFDSYAGLPTYMEIDCHSLSGLKSVAGKLGYKLSDHSKKGLRDIYYELYGIDKKVKWGNNKITFKNAKKIYIPLIKKNKKLFISILNEQLKAYGS
jgi:predicted adenylyl cyclase CyaB